ncbi:SDR family NAD(P)-dependent oxidoreductase [Cognatishimia sp.]|uniref:SDR family NAD(P)-dependent oxidoreductase n=1 Tax=Cognatishimia sp. TaxID=2211648 RepID=UPI003513F1D2
MTLSGKHIIVTGGGTGVGAATAKALAAAGATVTIMGRRTEPLAAQGLAFQTCDVTDMSSVQAAFTAAREAHGPIAGVIANAGAAETAPFSRMRPETLQTMLSVNLIGVSNVWQAALPDLTTAGWGRLIAVASTAGLKGYAYASAYCAAKHGVIGLTRALALELGATDVTVNAICPGFVETPMLERSIQNIIQKTGMTEEGARASLMSGNPQKRFVQPGEVAETAVWLCSEAAKSVNGHTLTMSGGEI